MTRIASKHPPLMLAGALMLAALVAGPAWGQGDPRQGYGPYRGQVLVDTSVLDQLGRDPYARNAAPPPTYGPSTYGQAPAAAPSAQRRPASGALMPPPGPGELQKRQAQINAAASRSAKVAPKPASPKAETAAAEAPAAKPAPTPKRTAKTAAKTPNAPSSAPSSAPPAAPAAPKPQAAAAVQAPPKPATPPAAPPPAPAPTSRSTPSTPGYIPAPPATAAAAPATPAPVAVPPASPALPPVPVAAAEPPKPEPPKPEPAKPEPAMAAAPPAANGVQTRVRVPPAAAAQPTTPPSPVASSATPSSPPAVTLPPVGTGSRTPPATPAATPAAQMAAAPAAPPALNPAPQAMPAAAPVPTEAIPAGKAAARVNFVAGSSDMPESAKAGLKAIADRMNRDGEMRIQLMAYAGPREDTASQARRLSLFRALAVRSYLIEQGVRSTRMDVRALGNKYEEEPADRVDVVIADK